MSYVPAPGGKIEDYAAPDMSGVQYWHLVRSFAMKEAATAQMLDWLGLAAWVPLQVKTRRIGKSRMQVRHVPVKQAAMIGYVFAGFKRGEPDWLALFETRLIRTVVTITSPQGLKPYRVTHREVARIHERQLAGWPVEEADDAAAAEKFPVGETVRVKDDDHMFWGREYDVVGHRNGRVQVLHDWFGKTELCEIPLDALCKAA
jgi:transcription antitermination factor NusG